MPCEDQDLVNKIWKLQCKEAGLLRKVQPSDGSCLYHIIAKIMPVVGASVRDARDAMAEECEKRFDAVLAH